MEILPIYGYLWAWLELPSEAVPPFSPAPLSPLRRRRHFVPPPSPSIPVMALVSADSRIAELLGELHQLIKQTQVPGFILFLDLF